MISKKNWFTFVSTLVLMGCTSLPEHEDTNLLWSDKPAYTRLFANQNDFGLSTDVFDHVWEGEEKPSLPRVKHPAAEVKRWRTGEGVDFLDEETAKVTDNRYANPVRIWEAEPYPIGNGRLAASVFHGSGRDRYALNEVSFWSGGRNGGTINEKGDKSFDGEEGPDVLDDGFGGSQPVGDLLIDFDSPVKKGTFVRRVVMDRGEVQSAGTRKGVRYESEAFVSYLDQVMVMQYRADQPHQLNLSVSYAVQRDQDSVYVYGNRLCLRSTLKNNMRCVAQTDIQVHGGRLMKDGKRIWIQNADSCTFVVAVETNYKMDYQAGWRGEEPEWRIASRMKKIQGDEFAAMKKRHVQDFGGLYSRLKLHLPAAADSLQCLPTPDRLAYYKVSPQDVGLEEILFNYGRYLMISTSRPGALPAGLQGIWNGMTHAPWGNDYHSNINLQMVYWLAEPGNLSECHLAMIDYLEAMREPNRLATNEFLAAKGEKPDSTGGWLVYTSHNPFGGHGWQVNLPGSAWYGLHLWEHFAYTQDTLYLAKTGYPMLRELSRFWENRLKELGEGGQGFVSNYKAVNVADYPELAAVKAGTLVVPEGWSPEHGPRGEDGVSHDQEIVSELFKHTIQAAKVLHTDSSWIAALQQKADRMYKPRIGKKGNLMEWMIDRNPETDHRHTSHLFAVYPGSTITLAETPELAEAARKSLLYRKNVGDSRRGWAWSWRAMLWARLHDGNRAHQMVQGLLCHNMLDNLLASHKIPLQIDANYGMAAAMLEMLAQSQNGIVHLLPAPCDAWNEGTVKGMKLRGNLWLDMSWKDGKVLEWKLRSTHPCPVRVQVNGCMQEVTPDFFN